MVCEKIECSLVVIGGVGYNKKEDERRGENLKEDSRYIKTKYGDVYLEIEKIEGEKIAMIPRHFGERHVPPHKINYKALVSAAATFNAPVLSINSVGCMKNMPVGSFLIPNDFVDMTKTRENTFFNEKTVHTDMSDPYCKSVRDVLKNILDEKNIEYNEGIYVATEGPRFETKAEIRFYKNIGDAVGMTGVPEVVLAKEAGLCYASLCLITNYAAGIEENKILTIKEVTDEVEKSRKNIREIIPLLAKRLKNKNNCNCKKSLEENEI
ncbi:MAG: MTAP family purine nucleoside phosphorylase [Methanosarcinaceae archaeon]|nr:MTAP family purine nucleoside phosphorylase [Methanosarcinaceae archaeon]